MMEFRIRHRMTRAEAARAIGLPEKTVARIEDFDGGAIPARVALTLAAMLADSREGAASSLHPPRLVMASLAEERMAGKAAALAGYMGSRPDGVTQTDLLRRFRCFRAVEISRIMGGLEDMGCIRVERKAKAPDIAGRRAVVYRLLADRGTCRQAISALMGCGRADGTSR
ncbi:hypothetical protein [Phenylobacterium sp.]|uniref:hypothetical protein n=1 Tax=Phenylobacterium sp. TaxID=1871053 RepID=UPI00301B9DE0